MEKIRIFLVEDEAIIRNGVKRSIDWEKEGYDFVGEAGDGELAYPMIMKEKPDILITDIRMPFMDGLELSRLVKEKLPDIRIVLLTGYGEFEYAKEAISIGVEDYLLKPISSARLLEALGKVRDSILKEQEEKELLVQYQKEMQENTEQDKIKFFQKLLFGGLSVGQLSEEGRKYGMELMASAYQIVLFRILPTKASQEEPESLVAAYEKIDCIPEKIPGVYAFHREIDGWAFLIAADSEEQLQENEERLEEKLKKIMGKWPALEYFGASGMPVERLRNVKESFKDAERAFAGRFVLPPDQIVSGVPQELSKEQDREEIQVNGIVQVGTLRTMVNKFLNNGTREEVDEFGNAYLEQIQQDNLSSNLLRQYLIVDVSAEVLAFIKKLSPDETLEKEAEQLNRVLQESHSIEELHAYLSGFMTKTIDLRDDISGRKYTDLIETARKEIEEHYMSDEISLNTVSVSVGMSPSYFSSVFSRETGKTFVEYLTEVRMNKAKEYLMCSPMKMTEIAFEVGYRDPHYFSYIFKKTQGCSPKEYRARRKD